MQPDNKYRENYIYYPLASFEKKNQIYDTF
jgi:hypothetical protein